MSINGKKVFQLYHDMAGVVGVMTDEQAGKLLKAILTYVNGSDPEFDDPVAMVAFQPIRMQLERDHQSYVNIVTRNRENGRKGGRPKKTQENPVGYLGNPNKPKKADTDTDKDKDKDTKETPLNPLKGKQCADGFDTFWTLCKRKLDKARALKAYTKIRKSNATELSDEDLANKYNSYCESVFELRGEMQYAKQPASWLNAASYDNEEYAPAPVTQTEPEPQYFEPANRSDILKVFPNRHDLVDTPWSELTPDVQQVINEKCKEL